MKKGESEYSNRVNNFDIPEDPVKAITGNLKEIKLGSVESHMRL
ncbi:MAG: hypothetical protein ACTSW1_09420 [Candidatus Hodarchaeales archaeon]